MKISIGLDIEDIKQIIAEKFNVIEENVNVVCCGYEGNDGIYPGRGYYCDIEVTDVDFKQG